MLRQTAVTREGKDHARDRGDGRKPAQPLADQDGKIENILDDRVHLAVHRPEEHVPALLCRIIHIRQHQNEGAQHDVSEKRRPENRRDHAARDRFGSLDCLFRRMRRGVIAGDGVDRQKQAEKEDPSTGSGGPDIAADFAGIVGEGKEATDLVGGRCDQADGRQRDCCCKDQITRKVRQLRGQSDAHVVDERLRACDDNEEGDAHHRRIRQPEIAGAERTHEEIVGADVDGAEHSDETEQVEPGGQPAGETVTEDGAPVIEAAKPSDKRS